ncbi:MAG TPA: hypothetical protein VGD38_14940, partial [Pyrinomonadaceae bacterium]
QVYFVVALVILNLKGAHSDGDQESLKIHQTGFVQEVSGSCHVAASAETDEAGRTFKARVEG